MIAKQDLPSIPLLMSQVNYCPKTGIFTWAVKGRKRRVGAKVGNVSRSHGYVEMCILYNRLLAHRVAWAFTSGEWPAGEVDHINRVRTDNRISNLRHVTSEENSRNLPVRSDNTSGFVGVCFDKHRGAWLARIHHNMRPIHIGYFSTAQDAATARKKAEIKYGYHKNHGEIL